MRWIGGDGTDRPRVSWLWCEIWGLRGLCAGRAHCALICDHYRPGQRLRSAEREEEFGILFPKPSACTVPVLASIPAMAR